MNDIAKRITTWVRRPAGARRVGWGAALTLGLAVGVALGPGFGGRPDATTGQVAPAPPFALAAGLTPYSTCDQLVGDLARRALPMVGPTGFDGGAGGFPIPATAADAAAPAAGAPAAPAPARPGAAPDLATTSMGASTSKTAEGTSFSSTNNRTRGVDEPDIAKTDGRLLVSVSSEGWLHTTDATDGAQLGALRVGVQGPYRLLLVGNRAVVFGGADDEPVAPTQVRPTAGSVTVVDLADRAAPRVERRLTMTADVVDARLLGDTVRLVTRASAPRLGWFSPPAWEPGAVDKATSANKRVLEATGADDWLPTFTVRDGAGRETGTGRLYACEQVSRPDKGDGFDQLGVLSFDPASTAGPEGAVAVVGSGDTAYATGTHVWVATTSGQGGPVQTFPPAGPLPMGGTGVARPCCFRESGGTTQVHLFDVEDPAATRYIATGDVDGQLLDQTALDEGTDGTLRVVTTTAGATGITTMRVEKGKTALAKVGYVGGLARGEQVQSVRFVGDTAYVVTFRQIDPLFVLDLTDPAAPRLRGELKVPGYSALLAEPEAGRLLGIGMAGDAKGRLLGVGAGLFDVSDADRPVRLDDLTLASGIRNAWSDSEVLRDPHAFAFWRPARLAFVPVSTQGRPAEAIAVRVERDALVRTYTLRHEGRTGRGDTAVQRTLVVGDRVLTVSERGVLRSSLASGADQSWAPFAADSTGACSGSRPAPGGAPCPPPLPTLRTSD